VQADTEQPLVLPATAQGCKNHGQPRFDTLLERLCWDQLAPPGLVYAPTCPICAEMTVGQGGFYVLHADKWRRRWVAQRLLTRVAINRRRNVAEEGMLYSPFVIDEVAQLDKADGDTEVRYGATQFLGSVRRLPEALQAMLTQITHVGGSSSRGLGQVGLAVTAAPTANSPSVAQRLDNFTAALATIWQAFARLPGVQGPAQPNGLYFALTLQADAILTDRWGQPTMVYAAEQLAAQSGLAAELVASYAASDQVGGWNGAWGLPKPTALITKMGSTYLYRAAATADRATVVQALAQLETEGIGQRRGEGYGQVRAVHEFHLVRRGSNDNSNN